MYSISNNVEFILYDNINEGDNELFESLLSRHKIGLETSTRRNNFVFDTAQLLYYKCHKINFKRNFHTLILQTE